MSNVLRVMIWSMLFLPMGAAAYPSTVPIQANSTESNEPFPFDIVYEVYTTSTGTIGNATLIIFTQAGETLSLAEDTYEDGWSRLGVVYQLDDIVMSGVNKFVDLDGYLTVNQTEVITEVITGVDLPGWSGPGPAPCLKPFITSYDPNDTPAVSTQYNAPCFEATWDKVGFDPVMIVWIILIDILE